MKKKIFTLFAMMCCVVGLQAETVTKTWDFSEYEERVDLGGTTYTLTYNELTLVGLSGADAGKEYVSAATGFHCNGNSSSSRRYIQYTPQYDGTWTVTYRSNNASATDRITAIGTSVVNFSKEEDATSDVLAWGFTEGSTNKTISAQLEKGKTYYAYFANGGQSIMKLEYTYDSESGGEEPGPDTPVDETKTTTYYWDNFSSANAIMFADKATIQITGNLTKDVSNGNDIKVSGKKYKTIKLSNGAQNTYNAPFGYKATKVVFYSYVNADNGEAYWKEVNGVDYDKETSGGVMECFKSDVSNPDCRTFEFETPVAYFTYTNAGKQLCYVMIVDLVKAEDITVSISSAEYTTFITPTAVTFPETIKAYIVSEVGEESVVLSQVTNVPANTPVIVNGSEGTFSLAAIEGNADVVSGNQLLYSNKEVSGPIEEKDKDSDEVKKYNIYALANMTEGVGFYRVADGINVPARKAYLKILVPEETTLVKGFLALEGEVTAISNVEAASAHTSTIYNVAGQKVQNIKASGLYIVNGKKVFVK